MDQARATTIYRSVFHRLVRAEFGDRGHRPGGKRTVDGPDRRNLTDAEKGILTGKRYLIHDRDPLFTAEFLNMIADAGVKSVKVPR